MLRVESVCLSAWETNGYWIWDPELEGGWIIDCPEDPQALLDLVFASGKIPQAIWLTHAHIDHIAGLPIVRAAWPDLPVYIHEVEAEFLTDPCQNLSLWAGTPFQTEPATQFWKGGETAANGACQVLWLPGHSPGSVGYWWSESDILIGGDVLFRGSVGRSDFPHSDPRALDHSLKVGLAQLPDSCRVFPGHGRDTTLGRERRENPWLR